MLNVSQIMNNKASASSVYIAILVMFGMVD